MPASPDHAALVPPPLVLAGRSRRSWRQQARLADRVAPVVTGLLFAAIIIGPKPFSPHAADKAAIAESGNAFNRAIVFAAFATALPMALVRLERFLRLIRRNWPSALMVAWSSLSFLWATHPDLVLRRAVAFVLVYLTLAALAACTRDHGDWLLPLAACFAVVTVLNIVAMTALPAVSRSDIGEMGIFDNKNGAGTMAMLAIIVLGTALAACRGLVPRLGIAGVIALAWVFLLATRSKTSIGVAALMMGLGPILYLVLGSRAPIRLAVLSGALGLLALAAVGYSAAGFSEADLRLLLFGDLTFTGRTEIWGPVVREIAQRPWLGHGFGSFWDTGAALNPLPSAPPWAWFMNAQLINTAHDGYLDTLLQTGMVGLTLVVAAILRSLWLLGSAVTAGGSTQRIAMAGALCLVLCLVLNNFLESYLFRTGDPLGYLFMFIMLQGEAARLRRLAPPAGILIDEAGS